MSKLPSHNYNTIYEFCQRNRVEVTMSENGTYNCYINYEAHNPPYGYGPNILDAIENGIINYIRKQNYIGGEQDTAEIKTNYIEFINDDAKLFRYYFSKKHGLQNFIDYYENLALETNPAFKKILMFMAECIPKTVQDINYLIEPGYPAVHNVWIQVVVYYESFLQEKYENLAVIRDLLKALPEDEVQYFHKMQETLGQIENQMLENE